MEADHLGGDTDMVAIVEILLSEQQRLGDSRQQVPQGRIDGLAHVLARGRPRVTYTGVGQHGGAEDVIRNVVVPGLGRRLGPRPDLADEAGVARFDAVARRVG